jgi:hypothetical protein
VTVPLLLRYYPRDMQAMRSRRLVQCVALFTVAFASCSDHDDAIDDPSVTAGGAGDCISCAGAGAGDDAGGSSSGGQRPSGGTAPGGKAGSATSADGGVGNTPGGEGGNGASGPIAEELMLCDRLTQVQAKEEAVSDQFERSAWLDCRVHWLPDLYVHPAQGAQVRDDYVNALERWNLRFWGCEDLPVETFELVWGEPPLSRGDVDILIAYYMEAAVEHLDLSPKEQDEMLAALKRLSTLVVTSDSLEPSLPSCDGGAGGAGGAGGDGPGGAGGADADAGGAGNAGEAGLGGTGNLGGAP